MVDRWFITGLAQGKGSFQAPRKGLLPSGFPYAVCFSLTLRGEGALELLTEINDVLGGYGKIYKKHVKTSSTGVEVTTRWLKITSQIGLKHVVVHFDLRPLRGRKLREYQAWRSIVDYYVERDWSGAVNESIRQLDEARLT